ncbi:homologous-pairing protein 2 homolog isoform X3 [Artibeus jamaicensis]|uniref:homologous-pairing protein 2 homolog isoform X3 n=1 Tax=Artibeus jamaicensis TaxID=9417 RepID=UPI00235A67CB|nr:homologous-pairing protein 2 homolog isoform X3 [Artibeus jamaicensis]
MSKGRAEAATGAPGILLKYLREQNRPYSAQDVFGNLQREHGLGKAAVVKALEQLAQQGKIKEKTYGKQKIYFADQDQFDMVSDADLQSLDAKIVALTATVQSLQQSCRHMEAELKELTSALTTPEMQKEIQELQKECAGYTERLKNVKAATNHVTPEEKEQVYRERQKYCKEWRKRKRMVSAELQGRPCLETAAPEPSGSAQACPSAEGGFASPQASELCDAILEGYPKSKKQFFEEVGIETDEDYNVKLPDP